LAAYNSKQYPMAGEVLKENLLLLSKVIAIRLWFFKTPLGLLAERYRAFKRRQS